MRAGDGAAQKPGPARGPERAPERTSDPGGARGAAARALQLCGPTLQGCAQPDGAAQHGPPLRGEGGACAETLHCAWARCPAAAQRPPIWAPTLFAPFGQRLRSGRREAPPQTTAIGSAGAWRPLTPPRACLPPAAMEGWGPRSTDGGAARERPARRAEPPAGSGGTAGVPEPGVEPPSLPVCTGCKWAPRGGWRRGEGSPATETRQEAGQDKGRKIPRGRLTQHEKAAEGGGAGAGSCAPAGRRETRAAPCRPGGHGPGRGAGAGRGGPATVPHGAQNHSTRLPSHAFPTWRPRRFELASFQVFSHTHKGEEQKP